VRRRLLIILAVTGLVTGSAKTAAALETPRPGRTDSRVRSIDYDPSQVVRITGVWRTASQIVFSPQEAITHIAIGDATAWDIAAEGGAVFLKPKAAHGPTDMLVTTSLATGEKRLYAFELTVASARTRTPAPSLYVLRFRYPADLKAAASAAIAAETAALSAEVSDLKLAAGALEGPHNRAYEVQGPRALEPLEVFDNGRFTVLRFSPGQPLPAIYAVEPDGTEALAPFDVRGDFVVIHATARAFRLRRGGQALCLFNESLAAPEGARAAGPATSGSATSGSARSDPATSSAAATGTASSEIERIDVGQAQARGAAHRP
jgi:type IV secretion system protein VirB9